MVFNVSIRPTYHSYLCIFVYNNVCGFLLHITEDVPLCSLCYRNRLYEKRVAVRLRTQFKYGPPFEDNKSLLISFLSDCPRTKCGIPALPYRPGYIHRSFHAVDCPLHTLHSSQ